MAWVPAYQSEALDGGPWELEDSYVPAGMEMFEQFSFYYLNNGTTDPVDEY